ncbi:MAG: hypothetical protein ACE365_07965, partial [Gammaproteobacteria bacterium]
MIGSIYDDQIYGDSGDNELNGYEGNDELFGGAGNDTLIGGLGMDTYDGGDGIDTLLLSDNSEGVEITFDTVQGSESQDTILIGGVGGITETVKNVEIFKGSEFDDVFKIGFELGATNSDPLNPNRTQDQFSFSGGKGNDTIDFSAVNHVHPIVTPPDPGPGQVAGPYYDGFAYFDLSNNFVTINQYQLGKIPANGLYFPNIPDNILAPFDPVGFFDELESALTQYETDIGDLNDLIASLEDNYNALQATWYGILHSVGIPLPPIKALITGAFETIDLIKSASEGEISLVEFAAGIGIVAAQTFSDYYTGLIRYVADNTLELFDILKDGFTYSDTASLSELLFGGSSSNTLEQLQAFNPDRDIVKTSSVTYSINSFEEVITTNFNDSVVGTSGNDIIKTMDGKDFVRAGDGDDIIDGGKDNDILYGEDGDDIFIFSKNSGTDKLFGGEGHDVIDLSNLNAAVNINVGNSTFSLFGTVYVLNSVEGVIGTAYDDRIIAVSGDRKDVIYGGDGDDFIDGREGHDVLSGGAGDDIIRLGTGINIGDGGDGFDIVDYSQSTVALVVDLSDTDYQFTTDYNADKLVNIEGVIGTNYNDTIQGNEQDNLFIASNGNDTYSDVGGSDTIDYSSFSSITADLNNNSVDKNGGSYSDVISGIENIIGTSGNDAIYGNSDANYFKSAGGLDSIEAAGGDDIIDARDSLGSFIGGGGNDLFYLSSDSVFVAGGSGDDTISLAYSIVGMPFDLKGSGFLGNISDIEVLIGSAFNDTLF